MRRAFWGLTVGLGLGLGAASACAPPKPAVDPAIAARARLAQADALVRAGCFDCLADALALYESVRPVMAVTEQATTGAVRVSALLALRERELGTTDSGYLERARDLASTSDTIRRSETPALDLIAILPWRAGANRLDPGLPSTFYQNRVERLEALKPLAARDELSAYVWLAYACDSGAALTMEKDALAAPLDVLGAEPLIAFKLASCPTITPSALEKLLAGEPRFREVAYFLGVNAVSFRKLDEADARYRDAYAWRPTWPAVTVSIANLAITAEDFDVALDFYDQTLGLAPLYPDALLGKVRALTFLDRRDGALETADQLLAIGRYPGDAHYWRAYNEFQLERYDAAWTDVEAADRSLINSDVPKLAGVVAINRRQLDVARGKLELSRQRNPADCQTLYYLHLVLAEQSRWTDGVANAAAAATCLDGAEAEVRRQIEEIRGSNAPEARKARQIARREQQIASGVRMRAYCWFNAAVGSYNLSRPVEARGFAEKVAADEQFGERARDLLARLAR